MGDTTTAPAIHGDRYNIVNNEVTHAHTLENIREIVDEKFASDKFYPIVDALCELARVQKILAQRTAERTAAEAPAPVTLLNIHAVAESISHGERVITPRRLINNLKKHGVEVREVNTEGGKAFLVSSCDWEDYASGIKN